jgi:hypothetical protein
MKAFIAETRGKISEYQQLITGCKVRDRMLRSEDDPAERKEIYREWGRWDIGELEKQIALFEESIVKTEDVIRQEDDAIREHSEVIALCRQRDKELAALGAKAEGS